VHEILPIDLTFKSDYKCPEQESFHMKVIVSSEHIHAGTHTQNHFTALLDFVQDYPGKPAPER